MPPKTKKRTDVEIRRKKQAFLDAMATGDTVTHAAKKAGVCRTMPYDWRKDPDFEAEYQKAWQAGTDLLEAEAQRRAQGWEETRIGKDGKEYKVQKHSDTLLIFLLKSRDRERFADHYRVDQTVTREAKLVLDFTCVNEDGTREKVELPSGAAALPAKSREKLDKSGGR